MNTRRNQLMCYYAGQAMQAILGDYETERSANPRTRRVIAEEAVAVAEELVEELEERGHIDGEED